MTARWGSTDIIIPPAERAATHLRTCRPRYVGQFKRERTSAPSRAATGCRKSDVAVEFLATVLTARRRSPRRRQSRCGRLRRRAALDKRDPASCTEHQRVPRRYSADSRRSPDKRRPASAGGDHVEWAFTFPAAYNLVRLPMRIREGRRSPRRPASRRHMEAPGRIVNLDQLNSDCLKSW